MRKNKEEDINRFTNTLLGHFSNKEQVLENPSNFAHINIYIRLLPFNLFKVPSFYSEQSYNHDPWTPYRQSIQKLYIKGEEYILENYGIRNSERIAGAGFKPALLENIKLKDLYIKAGCKMHFTETKEGSYIGYVEPGNKCIIKKYGKDTYLVSKVHLDSDYFISIDEGYDINSKIKVWGSNHGPLKFKRIIL